MGNQQTGRTFTEKDLEVLIKTSGKSEKEIRQWYDEFRQDSDNTNRMNKRQFQVFYTNLKRNPNLLQITDHIFRAFDIDHSGTIDFSEFVVAYIATTDSTQREKFEYAFEVYDINDDQLIDKKEIRKILNLICRILGFAESEAQSYTETIMLSFDTNHDKVITKNEFIDGCLHDSTLAKISSPFNL